MGRLLLCGVLVIAACGSSDSIDEPDRAAGVIATTDVWADVIDNMVCGSVTVDALIPAGADPHVFEASLADRQRLDEATVVVANGLGLEGTLDDTLEATEDEGGTVVRAGDFIDTLAFGGGTDPDPHVWLDPLRVADALPSLGDTLVDAGIDAEVIADCSTAYAAELRALDSEVEALVATLPEADRKLVTAHDALEYFADRYGFDVVGVVIPGGSTLGSANPADLAALVDAAEAAGVRAMFAESLSNTADIDAVARQAGADVVVLSIASLDERSPTYVDLVRNTARQMVAALAE